MWKKNRFILIIFLWLVFIASSACARELYEKGDTIYRDKDWPVGGNFGHAGILWKWDKSDDNERVNQDIIEATPPVVKLNNFDSFYHETYFREVRMKFLSYSQRNTIIDKARGQLGIPFDWGIGYKSPGISFRCDGFVEYCYEQAGADIIPYDTWIFPTPPGYITLSPLLQSLAMLPRTTAVVNDVAIIAPSIKNAKYPYYRGTIDLRATVGDSNSGSGIAKVKFYNNIPPGNNNYISADDHNETVSGLYKTTWSTTENDDGKHNICFKSYDQAGNDRNDMIEITVDNIPPFAVTNLDSSSHDINTWSNKTSITTIWTAAQDDTDRTTDVSGIDGYGTVWNTSATGLPPEQKTVKAVESATNNTPLPDGKTHYFHIRSVDKAGNWDDEAVNIGPFWVDSTAPNIGLTLLWEELDGSGEYVTGRCFRINADDPIVNNARSGLDYVDISGTKYSCNGSSSFSRQVYLQVPQWLNVEAKDIAGNIATRDEENPDPYFIQVPRWEDINDLDIPFEDYAVSPSTSAGIKDTVTVEYPLEKPAQVIINIYNSSGTLIKSIKDNYESTSGTLSFTWDGKNASSQVVPDGKYYYVIEQLDYISDALLFEKHGLIMVDNTLPSVAIESSTLDTPRWGYVSVDTTITEPNLDDIKVYYKPHPGGTYSDIDPFKIELINGKWHIELDATTWSDGLYDLKVEALDFAGNSSSQITQVNIQRVTTTDVKVYNVKTGMDYQQSSPRVYIDYFLSRQANVKLEIYTPGMSLVKQVVNATQNFGKNTIYWDGTNTGGSQVAGGPYKYKITSSSDPTLSIIGDLTLKKVKCYISSPWQGSIVRAYVPVKGYAEGSEFKSYKLEFGAGNDPTTWNTVISSTTPITNNVLGYWDTGYEFESYCSPVPYPYELLHGEYTLRLTVTDIHNNTYSSRANVIVGRVISNELGGEGISPDDKVHLIVEPLTLHGSFEVVSIMPVDIPEIAPTEKALIGDIYELQPPMLAFSRPAALTMGYTDTELGGQNESKLGIYIWDVLKKRWKYLDTTKDLTNNILTAPIREIPRYHAYIAILADGNTPSAPVIFDPASPIYRESAYISGITEPQNKAELFNNGSSIGILNADYEYGYFSVYLKNLSIGNNAITAKSTDPAGNISVLSPAKTIIVQLNQPSAILSIELKTPDFSTDYAGSSVKVGDTVCIELYGTDSSAATIDIAKVKLATSITNPSGIVISLTETGQNTGIYRGSAYIGLSSNETTRTIGAVNDEVLTISAVQNPGISISINVESTELIDAPSIYSATHSSVCQNTFEDNLGEWADRSGADGATVLRDNTTSKTGVYSAKITNEYEGGDFSCYALTSSYNAEEYPIMSFGYKITPDVKTNFKVKVNGVFKNIVFTDDVETDGSAIRTIGTIENVVKDGQWHHAEVNLYRLLKADEPQTTNFTVDEIIMGDWDLDYWYTTMPGNSNALGATYWIDNFVIFKCITDSDTVEISFEPNQSYAAGYSYILDEISDTTPDQVSEGAGTDIQYASLNDGNWYLHVASCDDAGNWSLPNHYILAKDMTPPELISVLPATGETSGAADIELQITDNVSGVDTDTISLEVEGASYTLTNQGLTYDEGTATLIFAPYNVTPTPIVFTNGQVINVRLAQAKDKAGNAITSYAWAYTYSITNDVTPPNPPTILYPETSDIGLSSVTFSWIATDTSGIAGYSYILDGTPDTIPDDTSEGVLTEKQYSNLPEGTYYFHIKAKDNAGNWSEATHFILNIAHRSLLVDDFNDGSDPNEIGGVSGVFDSGGGSTCHKCYVTGVILGSSGYSMMLNYNTVGANSYSGYWMSLNHANLAGYKSLSFWVKGAAAGEKFKVGLKDSLNHETKVNIDLYLKGGTSTTWQQVIIPLVMFKNVTGWADMDNFSIVFENTIDPSGDIYIEDIEFISENGKIVVDNFDDGHDPNAFGANYYIVTGGASMTTSYAVGAGIEGTTCYRVNYNNVQFGKYASLVVYLADINVSDADTLSFYIKGAIGGENPDIYLYDGTNRRYIDIETYKLVTTSWQKIDIPLIDFLNKGINLTHLREMSFVFEWETMSGTIFLDNIEFISYALSMKPTLDPTPEATNQNQIILSGTKSPATSIWINGIEVIPLDYLTIWSATFVLQDGVNNITVLARDSSSNESEAVYAAVVLDVQLPIPIIAADGLVTKNVPLAFVGLDSYDNYGIAMYSWNFGDGTPVTSGSAANHAYANSGTYNATLSIYDKAGNGPVLVTKEITVIDTPIKKVGGMNPDFNSIQDALSNVSNGSAVYVCPGVYKESMIVMQNKTGIKLIGDGAGVTTIEGNLAFMESEVEVNGFTIKYGEGEAITFANSHYADLRLIADAGTTAVNSEIVVKNCIIKPNPDLFTETFGKGIQIWYMYESSGNSPTIENNLIMNADIGVNLFSQSFGGAMAGQVKNNTFVSNDCGILLRMHKENPLIQDNIIVDSSDSGVHITYEDEVLLSNRIINIVGNDFFNNARNVWCDAMQEECTPAPSNFNLYENPELDADYVPQNPACDTKGYSLP